MKNYTQLHEENRCEIYGLKNAGKSIRQIAKELNRNPSTVSRELRRNKGSRGYRPKQAQEKALERRKCARKFTKMNAILKAKIESLLMKDWSPEQISGVLANEGILISVERIYQHVWANKKAGGILFMHLRHGHKTRKRKRGSKDSRGQIKNKVSIHDRDEITEEKIRIGDWEVDLVVGANHKGFILTLVDRVSKFLLIDYVEHKDSSSILGAVVKLLNPLKKLVLTITSDNGKEFADHEKIAEKLAAKFYFADTYASWQRGLNENTNGLLRQYFPKKFKFTSISFEKLKEVQNKLNHRPRKMLNFQSPFDIFSSECSKLGIIC